MAQENTPTRGVPVDLGDGKQRFLRYSLAARKRLIAQLGGEEKLKALSGDDLSTVVLEGIKASDPDMTTELLEDLIDMENLESVVKAMGKAMGFKGAQQLSIVGEASPAPTAAPEAGSAS